MDPTAESPGSVPFQSVTPDPALGAPISWPPPRPPRRPLDAGKAALVFLGYLGAQLGVGIAIGVIIAAVAGVTGRFDPADTVAMEAAVNEALPWILLVTMIVSGAVMVVLSRSLAAPELPLRDSVGAAWVAGNGIELALGLAVGLGSAIASVVLTSNLFPAPDDLPVGPLAELAFGTSFERAVWVILALVLAPPIEEMLFRGVMFGGFARSFGATFSSVLVTVIFVAMHLPEAIFYPPALIGVGLLALSALGLRLATGAIGPAISVHLAYNGVVVLAALLAPAL